MAQRPSRLGSLVTALTVVAAVTAPGAAAAQPLPAGVIVDEVRVEGDPGESYALYLPSDYSADRPWSLLLAFHPQARGRALVETYRAAAERYGYVVAGSNTSRNGPWEVSARAVRAMSRDVGRRFTIDAARIYLTGHSGGARVAMQVALGNRDIAGVIASSAGFPDAGTRKTVGFPVFATAGLDDFNYLELRRLDAALTSPHHLEIFDGGHALPPEAVAMQAIEWLELAAMRDRRRAVDDALVVALDRAMRRRADAAADPVTRLRRWRSLVESLTGLRDVAADRARTDALARDPEVARAVAADRAALDAEARALDEALALEARLSGSGRTAALQELDRQLGDWAREAAAGADSPGRHRARRLLAALAAGAASRVDDADYAALLARRRWRP